MIGTQYLYGGEGEVPEYCGSSNCGYHKKGTKYIGVDCSGFIWNLLKRQNINIGRSTTDMSNYTGGQTITKTSDLVKGDIVLFPGHVGLYIGDGIMIHAPKCGKTVCEIEIKHFTFNKGLRLTTNTKKQRMSSNNEFRILFASFSNKNEAEIVVHDLQAVGVTATIIEVSVNNGIYYRVVSPVTTDREIAEKQLTSVKELGYTSAYIEMP